MIKVMDLLSIFIIIFSVFSFCLGLFVYLKGRTRLSSILFAFLAVFVSLWVGIGVFSHYQNITRDIRYGVIMGNLSETLASLIFTSFLLFTFSFPGRKLNLRLVGLISILGVQAFLVYLMWGIPGFEIKEVKINPIGYSLEYVNGPGYYYVYTEFIIAYFSLGIINLVRGYRNATGISKLQIKYILLATGIAGTIGIFFGLIIPAIDPSSPIYYIGRLAAIVFILLTTYAILKHRFLDIRFILRKGTVYATTLAIVIGLYAYLVFVISQTTSSVFKIGGDITSIAIIILIALGFHPLRKIVEHALNEYIFPKRVDLRAAAKRITLQLSTSITEIEKIIKAIRDEARPALGVESIDLFFQKEPGIWDAVSSVANAKITVDPKDPLFQRLSQKPSIIIAEELEYQINDTANPEEIKSLEEIKKILSSSGAAAVVPIIQHPDTIIGILFLGPKTNQSAYTVEDIQFLKNLQQNLPLSLSGIILYYQAMKRVHSQIKK